jgi:hypothetical protein
MARPVTLLAFMLLALSVWAGFLTSTGIAADIGLDARLSGDEIQDQAQSATEDIETGAPTGNTLFGLYNVLSDQLGTLFGIINPGLRLLYNAGVPASIVGGPNTIGLLPPLTSFIKAIGVISFLRGWGL